MTEKYTFWIRAGIMVLGTGFIVLGITRGEVETVFRKAVQICMECIGIG